MVAADLQNRVLERLGDDPAVDQSLMHYTPAEVLTALNQCQRMFVLFTLCLETTATLSLGGGLAFYYMLSKFADWLLPLRIRNALGAKVRPVRLSDLAALDASWSVQSGTPVKYALLGFDLLALYKQDSSTITITYARGPNAMVNANDSPEIPIRYHPLLIDGAVPLLRVKEGAQEWQKTLFQWDRWMDAIEECADKVRARNKEQAYDYFPVELKRVDRSKVLQKAS